MFERPQSGELAILVSLKYRHDDAEISAEFQELAAAAGATTVGICRKPNELLMQSIT